MTELRFEWDKRKEKANVKKHGISFDEARTVFYADGDEENEYWRCRK